MHEVRLDTYDEVIFAEMNKRMWEYHGKTLQIQVEEKVEELGQFFEKNV